MVKVVSENDFVRRGFRGANQKPEGRNQKRKVESRGQRADGTLQQTCQLNGSSQLSAPQPFQPASICLPFRAFCFLVSAFWFTLPACRDLPRSDFSASATKQERDSARV